MNRSIKTISKNSLKVAAVAVALLTVADYLTPEAVQAQRQPCRGAACPQATRPDPQKPENPLGALVGAGTVGGAVLLLKRRKRSGQPIQEETR